jgi:hypothetical protein
MHVLILGITQSGKTTLAFRLAAMYKRKGWGVLVLDPDMRKEWNADFMTDEPETFLKWVKANKSCAVFVDESGLMIGRYSGTMAWLATNSRKWGHRSHFIAQRATQIDPLIRNQCTKVFLFKQSVVDSKILASEYVCEELKNANNLKAGEYYAKTGIDERVYKSSLW